MAEGCVRSSFRNSSIGRPRTLESMSGIGSIGSLAIASSKRFRSSLRVSGSTLLIAITSVSRNDENCRIGHVAEDVRRFVGMPIESPDNSNQPAGRRPRDHLERSITTLVRIQHVVKRSLNVSLRESVGVDLVQIPLDTLESPHDIVPALSSEWQYYAAASTPAKTSSRIRSAASHSSSSTTSGGQTRMLLSPQPRTSNPRWKQS